MLNIILFYFMFYLVYLFFKYFKIDDVSNKLLSLLSYKILLKDIDELPSKLIIIGSHTTIYDFIIGILFYYAILRKKYSTYIFMKNSFEFICNPILTIFDKKINFVSVDKTKGGLTMQICDKLKDKDNYIIFISPEGTRKCTPTLRTGYWYIAKNLDINILYIGIDFSLKKIEMEDYRKPFDTWEEENEQFIKSCVKYIPLYPERCFWTKDYYYNCEET